MQEIFTSQFISSTTCYSGARDSATLRLATETHAGQLLRDQSEGEPFSTRWKSISNSEHDKNPVIETMICVGHSASPCADTGGDWQVLCLMYDEQQNSQRQTQQQPQQQPHQTPTQIGADPTTTTGAQTQPQQPLADGMSHYHHHRRLTLDGTLATAAAVFPNTPDTPSFQRSSWAHQQPSAMSSTGAPSRMLNNVSLLRLILSRRASKSSSEDNSSFSSEGEKNPILEEYTSAPLPFRPLSPCLSLLSVTIDPTVATNDADHEGRTITGTCISSIFIAGVWVGSADDNLLRFFVPDHNQVGDTLKEMRLDHAGFIFQSPVMSLDFFKTEQYDSKSHHLAAACQDGTIRLFRFQCRGTGHDWKFVNVEEHTVIVDGPVVCLHWNHQPEQKGAIQVVAGSLCGYVCSLRKLIGHTSWQGPSMVAQGFWDERLQTEDSVLSVHSYGKYVAFGTYSGNVWVYSTQSSLSSSGVYEAAWKCRLHYPIHGLCFLPEPNSTTTMLLLVTTRRTLHILQTKGSPPSPQTCYSAELAKQRLEQLLAERNILPCSVVAAALECGEEAQVDDSDSWILL